MQFITKFNWDDNIKMDCKEVGSECMMYLRQGSHGRPLTV
jgi:hypothetical protein